MEQDMGSATNFKVNGLALARVTTGIVQLYAQQYGKGPEHARSHLVGDGLLCVLHDALTVAELTLVGRGRGEVVHTMRRAWQDAMRDDFEEVVESATGRRVSAFLSQVSLEPDLHIEFFMLEPVAAER
jgi:uncharacterized protein YbcI